MPADHPGPAASPPPAEQPADAARRRGGLNIAGKFVVYLVVLSIIPLLFLGFVSFDTSQRIVEKLIRDYSRQIVEAQKDYLDLQIMQIENLITNVASSEEIIDGLSGRGDGSRDYNRLATQARIGYVLNEYTNIRWLAAIDVIGANGGYFHVGDTLSVAPPAPGERERLFDEVGGNEDAVTWLGVTANLNSASQAKFVVSAAKAIRRLDRVRKSLDTVGVVVVAASLDVLHQHLKGVYVGDDGYLVVVDADGRIAFHPDRGLIGQPLRTVLPGGLPAEASTEIDLGGRDVIVTRVSSALSHWSVMAILPRSAVTAETAVIATTTTVALGLCLLLVAAAGITYSRTVVLPIRRITELFKRSGAGDGFELPRVTVRGRDEIAELGRWFNTFLDTLDEGRKAEAALRASEERYALAVRGANDALWDWDLASGRLYLAPRFAEMLGLDPAAIGDSVTAWLSRVHPDDRAALAAVLARAREDGPPQFEAEHRLIRADGEVMWMLARGLAVRDEAGAVVRLVGSLSDVTARKSAEARLREEATHDALTGLPNRRALFAAVTAALARPAGHGRAGLLLFDIDHFKDLNDTLGHAHGDRLLQAVAEVLRRALGVGDYGARLGGDEFAVLCAETDEASMSALAAHLIGLLREPLQITGERFGITVSVGLALAGPEDGADDLVRKTDLALYESKRLGRNRASFFDAALEQDVKVRVAVEAELRLGSPAECIELLFQPQVSPSDASVVRFEALARWHSRHGGGVIMPGAFIPAAERTGLIHDVTRVVVRRSLEAVAAFDAAGRSEVRIAVNLSAIDLGRSDFAEETMALFATAGIAPSRIEFEITEGVLLLSTRAVLDNIRRLGATGCRFALDDFGSGLSSFGYLKALPVDYLKIDGSFVKDMVRNPNDRAMVSAINQIGHLLGIKTIAEFVENEETLLLLRETGVDYAQGYFIHKPEAMRSGPDGEKSVCKIYGV